MTAAALLLAGLLGAAPSDTAPPSLAVFSPSFPGAADSSLEAAAEAVRLGVTVTHRFRVASAEETALRFGGAAHVPRCFDAACARRAARKSGAAWGLFSELGRSASDSATILRLALVRAEDGRVVKAMQASLRDGDSLGLLPFAQAAAEHLADDEAAAPPGLETASGAWKEIPWLNRQERVDNRRRWSWAGSGVLAAAVLMAYTQGQLLQEDENSGRPGGVLLDPGGATSFLRGFFAAPTLGAQYAAMGGAGIAQVDNALAVLFNPAGIADVASADGLRESAIMAKRSLPGGTPSFFLAYAGPLWGRWSEGLGVQYEGDGLANETTFNGDLAFDWSALGEAWSWLKTGAGLKLYLAKVGEDGTGLDRSTGHSIGVGLDLGIRVRLGEKVTGALAVRDAASYLRHTNTFTDDGYGEVLPPEYRIGAAYRVSRTLLLVMDGQKGLVADQADHVRLGAEKVAFGFLALRAGMHEVFGREEVRKLSVGFGVNSDGLGVNAPKQKLAINYAYEFGVDQDEPLGGGQQFSLEVSF